MQVNRLTPNIAAEVIGVALNEPLSKEVRDAIHQAFVRHRVLVFREQELDKPQQIAFTEHFGVLERHANRNQGTDDFPLLHVVTNLDDGGRPAVVKSQNWHTDKSFRPAPSMATLLHAKQMPPNGGDTCFADMHAAFAALPEPRQQELRSLRVVHSWEHSRDNVGMKMSAKEVADAPPMSHPLVRLHPETGAPALFLGMHAAYIEDMPFAQGQALIAELERHATQPEFIYRHQWAPGDLLMWDNRCLLHRADANFETAQYPRVLHRTCLRGTPTEGQHIAAAPAA